MAAPGVGDPDTVGRDPISMVTSLPITLLVGLLLGFMAGLGVGGGSLLILWLTMVAEVEPSIARVVNLLFFLCAAGGVTLLRWRKGALDLKTIHPAILAGCITAGIFSWVRYYLDTELLRKLFGVLLLITGLREVFYRPRNAK